MSRNDDIHTGDVTMSRNDDIHTGDVTMSRNDDIHTGDVTMSRNDDIHTGGRICVVGTHIYSMCRRESVCMSSLRLLVTYIRTPYDMYSTPFTRHIRRLLEMIGLFCKRAL